LPEILEMMLTEEEASLLLLMPGTVRDIATRTGMKVPELTSILEDFYLRGFIVRKETTEGCLYGLVNDILDFFLHDKKVSRKLKNPRFHGRFQDLMKDLFEKEMMRDEKMRDSIIPQARVIPIERTISMEWGEILPLESISAVLDNAKTIAQAECTCRVLMRNCENPTDNCILLDDFANIFVERGVAHEITKEEALDILERSEELGLVHHLNNTGPEGYLFICSCCTCCCMILRGMIQLGKDNVCCKSRYIAKMDSDKCEGCGNCESRCLFGAVAMVGGKAKVDEDACFGCGLCASDCPSGAIEMILVRGPEHITDKLQEAVDVIDDLLIRKD